MTGKIFRSILFATITVLFVSLVIIMGVMYGYSAEVERKQLRLEMNLAEVAVEMNGEAYLSGLDLKDFRITWVSAGGDVIYDTDASAEYMENHSEREEIREALTSREGESSRYSSTLTEKTLYYARRLDDGSVLRISVSNDNIISLVFGIIQPIALIFVIALLISAVLANRMSKRIVEPLNWIDLENPLENDVYEELSPLLNRINRQHRQISTQLKDLKKKSDEFGQITGNMNEGLVLLTDNGGILSINPAAAAIFETDSTCVGQDFLTVDRSPDMNRAIQSAITDGHSELHAERGGREYQFDISRIESDGTIVGAVLLAFDVTERAFAERNRREFTANVSHELKTPLQTIIGSAELIKNGLVKPDDLPRFIGHIHKEASRLVILIDDIIRLSQIDEEIEMTRENLDLYSLINEAAASLHEAAAAKNIKLKLTNAGTDVTVNGVRRLIYEIIFNLCDNAVKYNSDGGSVEVIVSGNEKETALTVRDSGIGINPEHQSRIFERFYRADKSHSKQSGGTGLGLSIVKNAAKYHKAKIELQSKPGIGTSITVRFPKSTK